MNDKLKFWLPIGISIAGFIAFLIVLIFGLIKGNFTDAFASFIPALISIITLLTSIFNKPNKIDEIEKK